VKYLADSDFCNLFQYCVTLIFDPKKSNISCPCSVDHLCQFALKFAFKILCFTSLVMEGTTDGHTFLVLSTGYKWAHLLTYKLSKQNYVDVVSKVRYSMGTLLMSNRFWERLGRRVYFDQLTHFHHILWNNKQSLGRFPAARVPVCGRLKSA